MCIILQVNYASEEIPVVRVLHGPYWYLQYFSPSYWKEVDIITTL